MNVRTMSDAVLLANWREDKSHPEWRNEVTRRLSILVAANSNDLGHWLDDVYIQPDDTFKTLAADYRNEVQS
jgi:hypothetical protein